MSRERLFAALAPALATAGADLEELTVDRAGRRSVVRLVVDRDGGVTLDDVAELSRLASEALDAAEAADPSLLPGPYVLEVSSPGVDRPLTLPRHWRRSTGRLVRVVLADGGGLTGRLLSADGDTLFLEVAGVTRDVALADVLRGEIQVEFSRAGQESEGP